MERFGVILGKNDIIEREERDGGGNSLTNDKVEILRQLFYRYSNETSTRLNNCFFHCTGRFEGPGSDLIGSCFLATEPSRKDFKPNRIESNRTEPNKIQMSEKSQKNQNIIRVCTFLLKRYFICTS